MLGRRIVAGRLRVLGRHVAAYRLHVRVQHVGADRLHVLRRPVAAERLCVAWRFATTPSISLFSMLSPSVKFAVYVASRLFVAEWLCVAGRCGVVLQLCAVGQRVVVGRNNVGRGGATILARA